MPVIERRPDPGLILSLFVKPGICVTN